MSERTISTAPSGSAEPSVSQVRAATDDPGLPADVHVRTSDGTTLSELTDPLLDDLLAQPPDPDFPLLTASRGEHDYIQARLLPDGVYEVEYRSSEADEHCQLYTPDVPLVRDVMWAWIAGDAWWRDGVAWARVDPAIAELTAVRQELEGLLDGLSVMDDIQSCMDDALARVDELMVTEIGEPADESDASR